MKPSLLLCLVSSSLLLNACASTTKSEISWMGKTENELRAQLGEPTEAKDQDGRRVLIYRTDKGLRSFKVYDIHTSVLANVVEPDFCEATFDINKDGVIQGIANSAADDCYRFRGPASE